jgi:hypothetical protein
MGKSSNWLWLSLVGVVAVYSFTHSAKEPCSKTQQPIPYYYHDLESYRHHALEDAIEEIEEHNGDQFDKDAAKKRVAAIPDATLDAQRQEDLAFLVKTRDADTSCSH